MRNIEDILHFRTDIAPFLVHLTKQVNSKTRPREVLKKIVEERRLLCGDSLVSDGRFGIRTYDLDPEEQKRYFSAICFTETPIGEIHCLLNIAYRSVDLAPYGLIFLKDKLAKRGVSPVIYLNNERRDMDGVFQDLCQLRERNPRTAEKVLPLLAVFGEKITPFGTTAQSNGHIDFRWEREWRYPYASGPLTFTPDDVFVGLCPNGEIEVFEGLLPGIGFIDPTRNMKWYATKLIEARQRLDIKFSVL